MKMVDDLRNRFPNIDTQTGECDLLPTTGDISKSVAGPSLELASRFSRQTNHIRQTFHIFDTAHRTKSAWLALR